jgi:hypothetical protein
MKWLFWGCLFLGLYFIYSFLKGQRSLTPSRLNLKQGEKNAGKKNELDGDASSATSGGMSPELGEKIRSLNVMFMYNSHNFDAHEVLGIQAGASLEQVKQAFAVAMKKADPDSKEFIECALRAVLEDHKRSR